MNTITTSLAVSKKLKEAGWETPFTKHHLRNAECKRKHETVYYWNTDANGSYLHTFPDCTQDAIAAPTAEEVLRELPVYIERESITYSLCIVAVGKHWNVHYSSPNPEVKDDPNYPIAGIHADTLANAAAEMWIYLKTNGLL